MVLDLEPYHYGKFRKTRHDACEPTHSARQGSRRGYEKWGSPPQAHLSMAVPAILTAYSIVSGEIWLYLPH